jgi:hypothetical protein
LAAIGLQTLLYKLFFFLDIVTPLYTKYITRANSAIGKVTSPMGAGSPTGPGYASPLPGGVKSSQVLNREGPLRVCAVVAIPELEVRAAIDKFSIFDKVTAEGDLSDITGDSTLSVSAAFETAGIINPLQANKNTNINSFVFICSFLRSR